jgi:hypothetical protein
MAEKTAKRGADICTIHYNNHIEEDEMGGAWEGWEIRAEFQSEKCEKITIKMD